MATCKDCFHFDVCRAMLEATCGIRIDDDFKGGAGSCKKFENSADVAPRAGWISVEEGLPEESCECLAISENGVIYLLHYSYRHKAFNATDDDDGDYWKLSGFTHWMPLPEPPKGE